MFDDEYLRGVIAAAERQTDSVEQRAINLLYQRGDMANLDCAGQRVAEARVRKLLLSTHHHACQCELCRTERAAAEAAIEIPH